MATMTAAKTNRKDSYDRDGFWIERGLFPAGEIQKICDLFMDMHAKGGIPGFYDLPKDETLNDGFHYAFGKSDPLFRFPRVMHPHRYMPMAKKYLLDPRVLAVLEDLLGEPALAAQSMFYFKPAGARGQAWHQDNYYLRVSPGSCIAAWIAVDRSWPENGGLQVIPQTHQAEVFCPDTDADSNQSFTKQVIHLKRLVKVVGGTHNTTLETLPEGVPVVRPDLMPGDVLFFNGSVVHGSGPNQSNGYRRSYINHYVPASTREIAVHYMPLIDKDGNEQRRAGAEGGGPCGDEQNKISEAH